MRAKLSICAIIAVRNEYPYLKILLPYLAAQDIDVVIIDHGSNDGSERLFKEFKDNPVIRLEQVPYSGFFSLSDQLSIKAKIISEVDHDWIIHHDADEIMEHSRPGSSLRDAIFEAEEYGSNVINFDEFVFLPEKHGDYFHRDYYRELLRYYFYEPHGNRLNRVWKRDCRFKNLTTGGHIIKGEGVKVFPGNHILRHYIVLSERHAKSKYLNRTFDEKDSEYGWHRNRIGILESNLGMPGEHEFLYSLENNISKSFYKGNPAGKHFWDWPPPEFH